MQPGADWLPLGSPEWAQEPFPLPEGGRLVAVLISIPVTSSPNFPLVERIPLLDDD
jgi:hypothetical protein